MLTDATDDTPESYPAPGTPFSVVRLHRGRWEVRYTQTGFWCGASCWTTPFGAAAAIKTLWDALTQDERDAMGFAARLNQSINPEQYPGIREPIKAFRAAADYGRKTPSLIDTPPLETSPCTADPATA